MKRFDLVCKWCYKNDPHHAPYETIEALTANKAKYLYTLMHPDSEYQDVLCRKSKQGSYDI